jgi:hypothetical protein
MIDISTQITVADDLGEYKEVLGAGIRSRKIDLILDIP